MKLLGVGKYLTTHNITDLKSISESVERQMTYQLSGFFNSFFTALQGILNVLYDGLKLLPFILLLFCDEGREVAVPRSCFDLSPSLQDNF